ncbi:alpha/beta hydrolase [Mycobacterium sp.]|uniref:alpha/beta hydrolase n=2 Tax=Mycobacterium sp. TaxID=1785 RepID=UPI003F98FF49
MSGHQGSIAVHLVNPVFRGVWQSAFHRYHDDLDGMRKFLDRAGAASGLLARPAPGCRIVDGELGGLSAREFHPAGAQHGRTVLYLHGGGFLMYAPSAYTGFLSRLANDLQTRVVVPAYRLAPEHPFPAAIDDCLRAYEALLDAGQEPSQLMVAGESAGANATLVTLQRARDVSLPMPAGAVMMSGGFDFSWASPSISINARRDTAVGARGLAFLQRWYRPDVDATDPLISPVFGDFAGLPPLLFQTGHTEVLRDDSVRASERARAAGVPVWLEVFPLVPHAWHQLGTWLPETRAALRQIGQFANAHAGWNARPEAVTAPQTPVAVHQPGSTS